MLSGPLGYLVLLTTASATAASFAQYAPPDSEASPPAQPVEPARPNRYIDRLPVPRTLFPVTSSGRQPGFADFSKTAGHTANSSTAGKFHYF